MGRYLSESDHWVSSKTQIEDHPDNELMFDLESSNKHFMNRSNSLPINNKKKKKKNHVLLRGYVGEAGDDDLKRTKSLTDDDLDELRGCLDLGFGFSYEEIPELCNTLPALELCYSMSQKFHDDQHKSSPENSPVVGSESASSPIANWMISSPGDHPEDVKARLKYWAQAVACTVRLCNPFQGNLKFLTGMKFLKLGIDLLKSANERMAVKDLKIGGNNDASVVRALPTYVPIFCIC